MRVSRPLSIVAGVSAIALATLVVASPASAATLPDGQKITIVDLIQAQVGPTGSQSYLVSPTDGASTAVGSVQAPDFVGAADVNDEGLGYVTITAYTDEDVPFPVLAAYNANTGEYSSPVPITTNDVDLPLSWCNGLDLQPNGEIIAACVFAPDGTFDSYIGVVAPDGLFTPFITDNVNNVPNLTYEALAYNAVNGELWAFASNDGTVAYLVDRANGTLGLPLFLDEAVLGADFDRDGQLFGSAIDTDAEAWALATIDLSDGDVTFVGPFTSASGQLSPVFALTVWGAKPGLAATGVEVLPIGLGSALLLLAGAAFIVTARAQRHRA